MNYKQPSFVGTHTAPTIKNATVVRGGVEASVKDFSYYPAKFYKRN